MEAGAGVVVREAAEADADALAGLLTELGYPADAGEVRERLAYWLADQASRVLVAERDGRVVGSIAVHVIPYLERNGRWLRIESLVVDVGQRRAGAGRALMAAAEALAREWGCLTIEVTSLRSRAAAQEFYRGLGFTDVCDQSARFVKDVDPA